MPRVGTMGDASLVSLEHDAQQIAQRLRSDAHLLEKVKVLLDRDAQQIAHRLRSDTRLLEKVNGLLDTNLLLDKQPIMTGAAHSKLVKLPSDPPPLTPTNITCASRIEPEQRTFLDDYVTAAWRTRPAVPCMPSQADLEQYLGACRDSFWGTCGALTTAPEHELIASDTHPLVAFITYEKSGSNTLVKLLNMYAHRRSVPSLSYHCIRYQPSSHGNQSQGGRRLSGGGGGRGRMRLCMTTKLPFGCCASLASRVIVHDRGYGFCHEPTTRRPCRYVTVLREPLGRLLSAFNYFCASCMDGNFLCHEHGYPGFTCPNMTLRAFAIPWFDSFGYSHQLAKRRTTFDDEGGLFDNARRAREGRLSAERLAGMHAFTLEALAAPGTAQVQVAALEHLLGGTRGLLSPTSFASPPRFANVGASAYGGRAPPDAASRHRTLNSLTKLERDELERIAREDRALYDIATAQDAARIRRAHKHL